MMKQIAEREREMNKQKRDYSICVWGVGEEMRTAMVGVVRVRVRRSAAALNTII